MSVTSTPPYTFDPLGENHSIGKISSNRARLRSGHSHYKLLLYSIATSPRLASPHHPVARIFPLQERTPHFIQLLVPAPCT